ncbi:MAG TPA: glycerophosphodiester phosphodiesterase family protein [Mycobacteriales bacterium]|nr:glycerophosphodiester phosphodiesterase family protein [Mycobacteriales bacterium]
MRIYAHRGASAYAPENTLASFALAKDLGAHFVELDVQRTKDGVLVVMHDDTPARTTDVTPDRSEWTVGQFTLAELQALDAGSWKDPKYAGEQIPTLDQVLDLLEEKDLGLLLEAKSPDRFPGLSGQIAAALRSRPQWMRAGAERLVVESFDRDFLIEFRAVAPRITLGYLGLPNIVELPFLARFCDQINPHFPSVDVDLVEAVHGHGMAVTPWTANEPADIERLRRIGVDGVITDAPDRAR